MWNEEHAKRLNWIIDKEERAPCVFSLCAARDEIARTSDRDSLLADVKRLNQMLSDTGYGQGQIDTYVAQCEDRDELLALLLEVEIEPADYCLFCKRGRGHFADCRLAAALAKHSGETT